MHDVRVATADDAAEAGRVLAAGFLDDPVMCWVFSEHDRHRKLSTMFGFLAGVLVDLGATYLAPGSCGAWTPPGTPGWSDDRLVRFLTEMAGAATAEDLERLGVLDDAMQAHHPEEPHWYLGLLATEPALRGRGLGAAVLSASLEVVDAAGLPAYLESTNPRNIPLYERHGFEVAGSIDLPGGPSLTPMWRTAR